MGADEIRNIARQAVAGDRFVEPFRHPAGADDQRQHAAAAIESESGGYLIGPESAFLLSGSGCRSGCWEPQHFLRVPNNAVSLKDLCILCAIDCRKDNLSQIGVRRDLLPPAPGDIAVHCWLSPSAIGAEPRSLHRDFTWWAVQGLNL
jgi:hypothetical protein